MRTIADPTPLQLPIASPQLLVELTLDGLKRYSTRGEYQQPLAPTADSTIQWTADSTGRPTADETAPDGEQYGYRVWQGGLLDVGSAPAWEVIELRLRNETWQYNALLLDGDWRGSPVRIWQLVAGEQVLLLDGELTGAGPLGAWVTLIARRAGLEGVHTPRLRLDSPVANHLPPAGSRYTWEGEVVLLEAAR